MIDPIYAHYFFSVISHFASGHRITVLIFFSTVNPLTLLFSNKLRVRLAVHVHVWSEKFVKSLCY